MLHKQLLHTFQRLMTYCIQNREQIEQTEKSLKESLECLIKFQVQQAKILSQIDLSRLEPARLKNFPILKQSRNGGCNEY